MTAVVAAGVPLQRACRLVGCPRASYYRHHRPQPRASSPIPQSERPQPAALSAGERAAVLEILNRAENADLSICQAFYRSWDDGVYVASKSSWYRIARQAGQVRDRRAQATGAPKTIPELVATGPNQVWSWDITKLKGPRRGQWFHLYALMDIYSRKATGWRVEAFEEGHLAQDLIETAVANNGGQKPGYLHSDNGAAMISQPVSALLDKLGISKSFSRPKVSNDNPYSEALFKTLKYGLTFPGSFQSLDDAREFSAWFFDEYNTRHRHSGIGWHTPDNVHNGNTTVTSAARRRLLDHAWRAHPERFTHRPKPPTLPRRAGINDPRRTTPTNTPNLSHTG